MHIITCKKFIFYLNVQNILRISIVNEKSLFADLAMGGGNTRQKTGSGLQNKSSMASFGGHQCLCRLWVQSCKLKLVWTLCSSVLRNALKTAQSAHARRWISSEKKKKKTNCLFFASVPAPQSCPDHLSRQTFGVLQHKPSSLHVRVGPSRT